jgi:hypothetical protein
VGVGLLISYCEERQALHCLEKTRSKLKVTVSTAEKLICNSQACHESGREWQLLNYKSLMGSPLRTCLFQRPHPSHETLGQTLRAEPTKAVQQGITTLIATQPNILTLRRDICCQSPYKKIKASPLQDEFRGNSLEHSLNWFFYIYMIIYIIFILLYFLLFLYFLSFNFNFYFIPYYCYLTLFSVLS